MRTDRTREVACSADQPDRFDHLFATATGFDEPYEYQKQLACGERLERSDDDWLSDSNACESMLIEIPTGFGKTGAVVLAWVWNRVVKHRNDWPRRLVYCLPMRTLVEQTLQSTHQWLTSLGLSEEVGLHVLMGGEDAGEWDIHPERNAVCVFRSKLDTDSGTKWTVISVADRRRVVWSPERFGGSDPRS